MRSFYSTRFGSMGQIPLKRRLCGLSIRGAGLNLILAFIII